MSDCYITTLTPDEVFADHTYQRPLDGPRARRIAHTWDRKLAGILEVSDRGPDHQPRYAIIDGQHRWAATKYLTDPPPLVANVHENLTLADEATLFDQLNRERRRIGPFDHYRARLAAGEWNIIQIQRIADKHQLKIDPTPRDNHVSCISTMEKIVAEDDALLDETLNLIISIWGRRRDAFDAAIIHGLALLLHHHRDDIDTERLADALLDALPRQIVAQAQALRDIQPGSLPVQAARAITNLYNRRPGRNITFTANSFKRPFKKPDEHTTGKDRG